MKTPHLRALVLGFWILSFGIITLMATGQIIIYPVTRNVQDERQLEALPGQALSVQVSKLLMLEHDAAITHTHAMGWLEVGYITNPILTIGGQRVEPVSPGTWFWIPEGVEHTHQPRTTPSQTIYGSWFIAIIRDESGDVAHGTTVVASGPLPGLHPGPYRLVLTRIDFPIQPFAGTTQLAFMGGGDGPTVAFVSFGLVELPGVTDGPSHRLEEGNIAVVPPGSARIFQNDGKRAAVVLELSFLPKR